MTETAPVIRFAKGDPVPEWLMAREAMSPDHIPGDGRFSMDMVVIDTEERFIAIPAMHERDWVEPIQWGRMQNMRLGAGSKALMLVREGFCFYERGNIPPGAQPGSVWINPTGRFQPDPLLPPASPLPSLDDVLNGRRVAPSLREEEDAQARFDTLAAAQAQAIIAKAGISDRAASIVHWIAVLMLLALGSGVTVLLYEMGKRAAGG